MPSSILSLRSITQTDSSLNGQQLETRTCPTSESCNGRKRRGSESSEHERGGENSHADVAPSMLTNIESPDHQVLQRHRKNARAPHISKQYACPAPSCNRGFKLRQHLNRHIRIRKDHAHKKLAGIINERRCSLCHKEFSRSTDLVKHERITHGEKYKSRLGAMKTAAALPSPPPDSPVAVDDSFCSNDIEYAVLHRTTPASEPSHNTPPSLRPSNGQSLDEHFLEKQGRAPESCYPLCGDRSPSVFPAPSAIEISGDPTRSTNLPLTIQGAEVLLADPKSGNGQGMLATLPFNTRITPNAFSKVGIDQRPYPTNRGATNPGNYVGCSQIATDVPSQVIALFNPQPHPNTEPHLTPESHSGPICHRNAKHAASSKALTAGAALTTRRLQDIYASPQKRCIKCWALKKPCRTDYGESRCSQCIKFGLPVQICSRERLIQHKPFEKWRDETYQYLFTNAQLSGSSPRITVNLRHYHNGPTLNVECYQFLPSHQNQTRVLRQNSSGWHSAETTAYCLTHTSIDISSYAQGCVTFALSEACALGRPVAFFFQLAQYYKDTPIIRQCLELYTNLRLMRIQWQFAGDETLGMAAIDDRDSAWYGTRPVPRMIQNQLGHLLELNMIKLDSKILKSVQDLLEKRERRMWVVVILAVFLLLHTREIDAGRNIYWSRYKDSLGFWIHPSKPKTLIDEAIVSCNSLLSHFRCMIGRKPLDLDWGDQKSKDMVDNDSSVVQSMKVLQAYVLALRKKGRIGLEACNLYEDGDPDSVGFTISSLMFGNMMECCEVKGFS